MSRLLAGCLLFAAVACSGGSDNPGVDGSPDDVDGSTPGIDAAPGQPDAIVTQVDCNNLPALPASFTHKPTITTSEDFTFDAAGNLVGVSLDTNALTLTAYDGSTQVVRPNVSSFGRGVRIYDGNYYVAEPNGRHLVRITPEGSQTTVVGDLDEPNGIAMHPNGTLYLTTAGNGVLRIDPATGDSQVVVSPGTTYDGVVFSRDFRKLYFNTEGGTVFEMDVDEDGAPMGSHRMFVNIPQTNILDGMSLDECGNLYVVEMTGIVWRVTPDKQITEAVTLGGGGFPEGPGGAFICAINFGSGVGGWKADHLYVMDFGGGVYEANLGVRGKPVPHLP